LTIFGFILRYSCLKFSRMITPSTRLSLRVKLAQDKPANGRRPERTTNAVRSESKGRKVRTPLDLPPIGGSLGAGPLERGLVLSEVTRKRDRVEWIACNSGRMERSLKVPIGF